MACIVTTCTGCYTALAVIAPLVAYSPFVLLGRNVCNYLNPSFSPFFFEGCTVSGITHFLAGGILARSGGNGSIASFIVACIVTACAGCYTALAVLAPLVAYSPLMLLGRNILGIAVIAAILAGIGHQTVTLAGSSFSDSTNIVVLQLRIICTISGIRRATTAVTRCSFSAALQTGSIVVIHIGGVLVLQLRIVCAVTGIRFRTAIFRINTCCGFGTGLQAAGIFVIHIGGVRMRHRVQFLICHSGGSIALCILEHTAAALSLAGIVRIRTGLLAGGCLIRRQHRVVPQGTVLFFLNLYLFIFRNPRFFEDCSINGVSFFSTSSVVSYERSIYRFRFGAALGAGSCRRAGSVILTPFIGDSIAPVMARGAEFNSLGLSFSPLFFPFFYSEACIIRGCTLGLAGRILCLRGNRAYASSLMVFIGIVGTSANCSASAVVIGPHIANAPIMVRCGNIFENLRLRTSPSLCEACSIGGIPHILASGLQGLHRSNACLTSYIMSSIITTSASCSASAVVIGPHIAHVPGMVLCFCDNRSAINAPLSILTSSRLLLVTHTLRLTISLNALGHPNAIGVSIRSIGRGMGISAGNITAVCIFQLGRGDVDLHKVAVCRISRLNHLIMVGIIILSGFFRCYDSPLYTSNGCAAGGGSTGGVSIAIDSNLTSYFKVNVLQIRNSTGILPLRNKVCRK